MEATGPSKYDNAIREAILEFFPKYDITNTGFVNSSNFPQLIQEIL